MIEDLLITAPGNLWWAIMAVYVSLCLGFAYFLWTDDPDE